MFYTAVYISSVCGPVLCACPFLLTDEGLTGVQRPAYKFASKSFLAVEVRVRLTKVFPIFPAET